eukprot:EG_transcript_17427
MQSAAADGYHIRAAVVLHPAGGSPKEAAVVRVPVLFGTGSRDPIAPSWHVWQLYRHARAKDKTWGVLKGADHNEAAGGGGGFAGRWPHWVGPFLLCHLSDLPEECDFFYRHFCAGDVDKFIFCQTPRSPLTTDEEGRRLSPTLEAPANPGPALPSEG